ncbi:unnamed protein product, partial [Meganyctiphanes norvegica]
VTTSNGHSTAWANTISTINSDGKYDQKTLKGSIITNKVFNPVVKEYSRFLNLSDENTLERIVWPLIMFASYARLGNDLYTYAVALTMAVKYNVTVAVSETIFADVTTFLDPNALQLHVISKYNVTVALHVINVTTFLDPNALLLHVINVTTFLDPNALQLHVINVTTLLDPNALQLHVINVTTFLDLNAPQLHVISKYNVTDALHVINVTTLLDPNALQLHVINIGVNSARAFFEVWSLSGNIGALKLY